MIFKDLGRGELFYVVGDPDGVVYMKMPFPTPEANTRNIYNHQESYVSDNTDVIKYGGDKNGHERAG